MSSTFQIRTLGPGRYDSPMDPGLCVDDGAGVLLHALVPRIGHPSDPPEILELAGPRRRLFFNPAETRVAVVTCGGLCPGLNDVVRAVTMVLWHRYGVRQILGLRYGFEGLVEALAQPPIVLSPEVVEDIHQHGGTILGSSRGPQDPRAMADYLVQHRIDVLFTIGGDGTQRGALDIVREVTARGLPIAVVGIPKTIDNDIAYTERTFGFETAVAMCRLPIVSAHMESKGVRNGVGLVKLMGRDSGFVAAYAALASSDVNLVLVPEVPFTLDWLMRFLETRLERKSHAVIVVAEGAGPGLVPDEGVDASGNRKFGDIGVFLKGRIAEHFKRRGVPVAVRYIDPSYTIRSAPANADDSVFCFQLAQNAAHAALSGRTSLIVALWNGHFVHMPMEKVVEGRKRIDPASALWRSVMDNTGQPPALA